MIPQTVGRYQIERELGRGGMAHVYLAFDPAMKRRVAVKILSGVLTGDREFPMRFQREAEVIAALEHPYIVPIYDFGEHDYQPYIVMRYMSGGTLDEKLRASGPLSVSDAVVVLERLCAALDAAHARGIIHRDLKPANTLFDREDEAFLSDFGIVKVVEDTANLTSGSIVGTAAYISPEQVYGDQDVSPRSDIYSLGAMLFEMLTGQRPFHAKDPLARYETAGALADALRAISRQIPSRRARRGGVADELAAALDALDEDDMPDADSPPPPDEWDESWD
jgi:serine/threonine protein kinase